MRKQHAYPGRVRLLLFLSFIVFAGANVAAAEDGLKLVEAPQVPIDSATRTGSTLLQIKNDGKADASLSLVVKELRSKITGQLLRTKVAFSLQPEVAGKPVFPQTIKAGDVLVLKVDVSNVTEPGESTADIFQGDKSLGVLTAVNDHPPFAVKPSGGLPDKPELTLERGVKSALIVKNDDAVTYPVSWRLLVKGVTLEGKSPVFLAPNDLTPIEIDPPGTWFEHWIDGFFKPEDQDGILTLSLTPGAAREVPRENQQVPAISGAPAAGNDRSWPSKSIATKIHLNYWSAAVRQVVGNVIILLVLVAGGIASLLVNAYLPNRLRSATAEEKLGALGRRTGGISTKVDSRLRVLIRVERLRLRTLLKSRGYFSPDFSDAFSQLSDGIAALTSRIEAAEQLDTERHRFDLLRVKLPPTLLSLLNDSLQEAADLLRKLRPSQAEIDLAKTRIAKASELISKASDMVNREAQDDEFAKQIIKRLKQLKASLASYELTAIYKTFHDNTPGPFVRLTETYTDPPVPTEISARDYAFIDTDLAKLAVILDYIRLHQARSEDLQKKLQETGGAQEELMKLLVPMSWECIRSAQLLVRQVQCGIFEKDLRDVLPQGVSIDIDRQVVRADEPIEFSVRFHHPEFDRTAAREEWSYSWDFGDGLEERGWSAWHYYPLAKPKKMRNVWAAVGRWLRLKSGTRRQKPIEGGPKNVAVHFKDRLGNPIIDNAGQQIKIPRPVEVKPQDSDFLGQRTKVEMARLAIGLLVAIIALAAGAKEQLLKLEVLPGLLAVFVIGFAADTIKNLVTQAPAKP